MELIKNLQQYSYVMLDEGVKMMTVQQWCDVGFVIAVALISLRSLFGRKPPSWKSELQDVEQVLRGLVLEAGNASEELNSALGKRKRELETLLSKIEVVKEDNHKNASPQPIIDDDLPNDSWRRPFSLEKLKETLAQATDEEEEVIQIPAGLTLEMSTFKIARRLLLEGKEIHLVAKKVESPIAEIRFIERALIKEGRLSNKNIEEPTAELKVNGVFPRPKPAKQIIETSSAPPASNSINLIDQVEITTNRLREAQDLLRTLSANKELPIIERSRTVL
jgi:hypothetical protein